MIPRDEEDQVGPYLTLCIDAMIPGEMALRPAVYPPVK